MAPGALQISMSCKQKLNADSFKHEMNLYITILVKCKHTVELQWLEHLWNHKN